MMFPGWLNEPEESAALAAGRGLSDDHGMTRIAAGSSGLRAGSDRPWVTGIQVP